MQTENILIGIILVIVGIVGLSDNMPIIKKIGSSYSGKSLFASIGLFGMGVYLILKQLMLLEL